MFFGGCGSLQGSILMSVTETAKQQGCFRKVLLIITILLEKVIVFLSMWNVRHFTVDMESEQTWISHSLNEIAFIIFSCIFPMEKWTPCFSTSRFLVFFLNVVQFKSYDFGLRICLKRPYIIKTNSSSSTSETTFLFSWSDFVSPF